MNKVSRGYVYKLIDDSKHVMYVGSTGDIARRIREHISGKNGLFLHDKPKEVEYCELPSRNDALIAEMVLIQKYKPPKNTQSVNDGIVSLSTFDECSVEWMVKQPEDFLCSKNESVKDEKEEKVQQKTGKTFGVLRELFPNADLRRDSVTNHQKHCLFAAFMQNGEYWFPKMTDFEVELLTDELFRELSLMGVRPV